LGRLRAPLRPQGLAWHCARRAARDNWQGPQARDVNGGEGESRPLSFIDWHRKEGIMGAWGISYFQNDDADNFATALPEAGASAGEIEELLQMTLLKADGEGYMDIVLGQELVAASAVVAWLTGLSQETAPEFLLPFLASAMGHDFRALAPLATRALDQVLSGPDHSELLELWKEANDFGAWLAQMERLKEHLQIVSSTHH